MYCSKLKRSRSTTGAPAPHEARPIPKADLGRRSYRWPIPKADLGRRSDHWPIPKADLGRRSDFFLFPPPFSYKLYPWRTSRPRFYSYTMTTMTDNSGGRSLGRASCSPAKPRRTRQTSHVNGAIFFWFYGRRSGQLETNNNQKMNCPRRFTIS